MHRPGLFALAAALACNSGCELLHVFERPIEPPGEKIKMPKSPTISAKYTANCARVDEVAKYILTMNTFPGIEPVVQTFGVKEPVLFHRGTGELFISEGLVERCKTDEELAAVMCSEMGQMKAEMLAAKRIGPDREADMAPSSCDSNALARELLTGAGIDPANLDRVAPLIRDTAKNDGLRKQMAGSAPAPQWRR
jgi:hypothetical protein